MKWFLILGLVVLACGCGTSGPTGPKILDTYEVRVETTKGTFRIELFRNDSPVATTQFVKAVNSSALVGRRFVPRREKTRGLFEVVFTQVLKKDPKYRDLPISRNPGFVRGMVGMIRVDKNENSPFRNYGRAFFICKKIKDPRYNLLNGVYTVVGQVIRGMDVVDRLGPEDKILAVSKRRMRPRHDGALMPGVGERKEDPPRGAKREREK